MYYDMNYFRSDCDLFNKIAGNDVKLTLQDFNDQQGYNLEECKEIQEGIDENNFEKIVDGVVDNFVTNFGHLQRLQALGVDVEQSLKLIAENNLSKYISYSNPAELLATYEKYKLAGVDVIVENNTDEEVWIVRRASDNKILKPANFVSVKLTGCIPENLLKNGLKDVNE